MRRWEIVANDLYLAHDHSHGLHSSMESWASWLPTLRFVNDFGFVSMLFDILWFLNHQGSINNGVSAFKTWGCAYLFLTVRNSNLGFKLLLWAKRCYNYANTVRNKLSHSGGVTYSIKTVISYLHICIITPIRHKRVRNTKNETITCLVMKVESLSLLNENASHKQH